MRRIEVQPLADDLAPRRRAINPTDEHLVAAAIDGDAGAFAALLRRHDDKMRGVAWRVVGSATAMDDVLQDAYLRAWRGLDGYRRESAFTTWLYTIVHRSAVDYVRARERRAGRHLATVDDVTEPVHVGDHAGQIAESYALQEALASLSADQLAVVTLVDGEGRDYDEVATMLDVKPGTVASRLHRARAALRAHLETMGEDR